MTTHEPPHDAPRRFGRYVLLDRIGAGGMAEVFRARTYGPGGFFKEVAVKQILTTLLDDRSFVSMFVDEARVTAFLNHPNIVQVVDLGDVDRRLYIAMEFVSGKDLLDILAACARRSTRLSLEHALLIVTSVLAGLDYAHNAANDVGHPIHVVHRDVSPSNILVGYNGHVKIGDFGIAKSGLQSTRTDAGTQKGKLGYMSPEQVTGAPIDPRSDVFAAAVILFEMLTMSRLFKAGTDLDVMLKIRDGKIESDLEKLRDYPESLRAIIRRGLDVDPAGRFESAGRFLEALYQVVQDLHLVLRPASLGSFLAELFADEVGEDRMRRAEDPEPASCYDGLQRVAEAIWRYRDAAGQIHPAMTLPRLQQVLSQTAPDAQERLSYQNGPWHPVRRFVDLCRVERPQDPNASQHAAASPPPPMRTTADWEDLALAAINPNRARRAKRPSGFADAVPISQGGRSERVLPVTSAWRPAAHGVAGAGHVVRTSLQPPAVAHASESAQIDGPSAWQQSSPAAVAATSSVPATSSGPLASDPKSPPRSPAGPAWRRAAGSPSSPEEDASLLGISDLAGAEQTPDEQSSLDALLHTVRSNASSVPGWSESGQGMVRPAAAVSRRGISAGVSSGASNGPRGSSSGSGARFSGDSSLSGASASGASIPRDGVIGSSGMVRTLFHLWKHKASGLLEIRGVHVAHAIVFDRGAPQLPPTREAGARFMEEVIRRGWLGREKLAPALGRAAAEGLSLVDEVLRYGWLSSAQVSELLAEVVAAQVMDVVECFQGRWSFDPDQQLAPNASRTSLHLPSLLARGVQERLGPGFFAAYFRMLRSSTVVVRPGARSAERLQLSARALRMLHNARPSSTVQEMVDQFNERFGWSEDETLHSLYLLIEFELFSVTRPW